MKIILRKLTKKQINKRLKKKKIKNEKQKRIEYINKYKKLICENTSKVWIPKLNIPFVKVKTNSSFTIDKYTSPIKNNKLVTNIEYTFPSETRKCIKIDLNLNCTQKKILFKWFEAYVKMYNETIYFIKTNKPKTINYKNIRTNSLKNIKKQIIKDSQLSEYFRNTRIYCHILDCAIKLACSNYKSAWTNYRHGNIKHFRIRYWRQNKKMHLLEIEKSFFKHNSICPDILGEVTATYNNKPYSLTKITNGCMLHYNSLTKKFQLLNPIKTIPKVNDSEEDTVSLDPGIRDFMTGISANEVLKIGGNMSGKIRARLERTDEIKKNPNIPTKIKRKHEKRNNMKISHMVDEMHWKVANYLVGNYKTILIGDLSVKGITKKETSQLPPMTKRIGYKLKFYTFRQRLEYKCQLNKVKYAVIDERFTSKMCSVCGHIKENLGGSKIFDCESCHNVLDRDVNGCRGIFIKSFANC